MYNKSLKNIKLNPNFITGLTEAEGCFSVTVYSSKTPKFKRTVKLEFTIKMLDNETELLTMVETFFNCGNLWHYPKDHTIRFRIADKSSIKNKLIPHFLKYPLRGTKYLDFLSFIEAFNIIERKEHLTNEGLNMLYDISKTMNKNREFPKEYYSPEHTKEKYIGYIPLDGHYINGFIAGDGSLMLHQGTKFGLMSLDITQHRNNRLLMDSLAKYFESPSKVRRGRVNDVRLVLIGSVIWENILFKHFEKYPIYGTKNLRLDKLILIGGLKKDNKHLIQVGSIRKWRPDYKLRIIKIWNN